MNARHRDSDGAVRGEQHVDDLRTCGRVEHRGERIDFDEHAVHDAESRWRVHPCVDRDDERAGERAAERDHHTREHMCRRPQAIPAVEIEPEEDRLEKEGETFQRKRHSDDGPGEGHEGRP